MIGYAEITEFLAATCETWLVFHAPSFGLDPVIAGIWGKNQEKGSSPLAHSLTHSLK